MSQFLMVMKGSAAGGDWEGYVETLIDKDKFRGGSSLGNGVCIVKNGDESSCIVTGYIRFTAENIAEAKSLLVGNPVYESGGAIELLEEVQSPR